LEAAVDPEPLAPSGERRRSMDEAADR
jgi:hypothetical protein